MSIAPVTALPITPIPAAAATVHPNIAHSATVSAERQGGEISSVGQTPQPFANATQLAPEVDDATRQSEATASKLDRRTVEEATAKVQKAVAAMNSSLQFQVDKETDKLVIKVVDTTTKEVIKQIPPQEILEIAKALDKLQGLLVREKA
jgi:flagellar protein FlaG